VLHRLVSRVTPTLRLRTLLQRRLRKAAQAPLNNRPRRIRPKPEKRRLR
jgi:hypothetical protein